MKSRQFICGNDSNEEFEEVRALIEKRQGNMNEIAADLGVRRDFLQKRLKAIGLFEVAKETSRSSKLRFRLPVD